MGVPVLLTQQQTAGSWRTETIFIFKQDIFLQRHKDFYCCRKICSVRLQNYSHYLGLCHHLSFSPGSLFRWCIIHFCAVRPVQKAWGLTSRQNRFLFASTLLHLFSFSFLLNLTFFSSSCRQNGRMTIYHSGAFSFRRAAQSLIFVESSEGLSFETATANGVAIYIHRFCGVEAQEPPAGSCIGCCTDSTSVTADRLSANTLTRHTYHQQPEQQPWQRHTTYACAICACMM